MKELQVIFKMMADGMKIMADGMNMISQQLNRLAESQSTEESTTESKPTSPKKPKKPAADKPVAKKPAAKRKAVKPAKAKGATDAEVVLNTIKDSDGGIDTKAISQKTGFAPKKVTNAIYRLKKDGKIQTVSRGVYKAA